MIDKKWVLPIIVLAQFCCTSLWFAGNAIMNELALNFQLHQNALAHLTSAVQFGFIIGTLFFGLLSIADRFSPSRVFFFSALFGAFFNLGLCLESNQFLSLVVFRFLTGFFLAGIYPVGMKIAADYYQKGLGKSLGFLVGALVLGTAFPHLLSGWGIALPWRSILYFISALAFIGGALILFWVPNGPYRKSSQKVDFKLIFKIFKNPSFRSAAFGYFGHMWELYAFWAFVPLILKDYTTLAKDQFFNPSLAAFIIIGLGGLSCIIAGYLAQTKGTKKIAASALLLSGICCLLSPVIFKTNIDFLVLIFLVFWGFFVIADSPLFSTLVAQNAKASNKGTALTIVNCIGFSITIVSIQCINLLKDKFDSPFIYMILVIGPIFGLLSLYSKK